MDTVKVLLLDIETAPKRAFVWGIWNQNISTAAIISDWYILSYVAKWLEYPHIYYDSIEEELLKNPNTEDDSKLLGGLWDLLDEADVVIAHNGDRFDIPRINTRFIKNGYSPPSGYRTIDTLKIARRHFGFTSNRLDWLGEELGLGRKVKTSGMEHWIKCLEGDPVAWKKMYRYNKRDVILLEKVYLKLRTWSPTHPNVAIPKEDGKLACPVCASTRLVKNGHNWTNVSKFQRYKCNRCKSSNIRGRENLLKKEQRESILVNTR